MDSSPNVCVWRTVLALAVLVAAGDASAGEQDDNQGLRAATAMQLRAVPIGLSFVSDAGYRLSLSDSDSTLLNDTYAEVGVTNNASPAYLWGGPYVQILPIAVLELRASLQYMGYFGNFGYLMVPDGRTNRDWDVDNIRRFDDQNLGTPSTGWLATGSATGRLKLGNVVGLVPFEFRYLDVNVDGAFYESTFDILLEPRDTYWSLTPTLGYALSFDQLDSYVLPALRWEHTESAGTDITTDIAQIMGLWKLPSNWWSGHKMELIVLGGYWVDHPNRQGTPYLAGVFNVHWANP